MAASYLLTWTGWEQDCLQVSIPVGRPEFLPFLRLFHSQFCSQLAASGKVVLAIEHRDGSGIFCMPRAWTNGRKGQPRNLLYLRESDVQCVQWALSAFHDLTKKLQR